MNTQHSSQPTHHLRTAIRSLLPLGALGMPALALAGGPTGEVIVGGDVEVNRPNTNTTVIDQASWRAIVDWQTFNIGAAEYVMFNQPGANAVILNRVVGGDPTSILGSMTANGQVFLVNPQGVFFGQSATLDVGGLLATTLDISNADFMAGNYSFTKSGGAPDAGVVNEGRINADGGYVVLAADHVSNSGVVAARAGHVVMAAGSAFTLDIEGDGLVNFAVDEAALSDMAGVSNAGTILADGGVVLMTAKVANDLVATAVNNEGLIQAHSISEQDGVIYLAAEGGDIVNAGTLDANGVSGQDGGGIMLHGDANIDLKDGSVITAAGNGAASGGVIRVIAEDTLYFRENATIRASGGDANGGFVEVSGYQDLQLRGLLDIGQGGQLLIDPTSMSISAGNASLGTSIGNVGVQFIEQQLNGGVDVAIVATNNIRVSSGNPATSITAAGGTGDLFMGIGTITGPSSLCALNGGLCIGTDPELLFTPGTGGNISLAGFDINILGDFAVEGGVSSAPIVSLGDVTAANISIRSTSLNMGRLTAANNVTIMGDGGAFMQFDDGVGGTIAISAGGDINISGAGTLRLGHGTFGDGSVGWFGQEANAGGNITITAGNVYGGAMTATTGNINVTANSGQIYLGSAPSQSGGGPVTAYADVNAGGNVSMISTDNGGNQVELRVGNVSGSSIRLQASNQAYGGALIRTGDLTASTDMVRLFAGGGNTNKLVSIDTGDITAATRIEMVAEASSSASLGGHITTGALSGEEIFVHHDGNKADISLGAITAINTDGLARVNVITGDGSGATQAGNITINGDITVSGQAVNATGGGLCSSGEGCFGLFGASGQPVAAQVQLRSGEFGGTSDTAPMGGVITVNGGIDITANLANVTVESSGGEGLITNTVTGQAGLAELLIVGAVADVSDSIAVTGPDAGIEVKADQVSIGGTVSVTGSGHDMTFTHVETDFSGSSSIITGSFSSTNNAGNAVMHILGTGSSSGGPPASSVTLGTVTVSGIGMAAVEITALNLDAQSIFVDAAAANYDRTITGSVFFSSQFGLFGANGEDPVEIDEGTLTVGVAGIRIYGGSSFSSSCAPDCQLPANMLTVNGSLLAHGVGVASINVFANSLNITGAVAATAAAGNVDGAGQHKDPSNSSFDVAVTQLGSFGSALVRLESRTGNINVGGPIIASGLVGGLEIDANSGSVAIHGVNVTGTGGVLHTTKSFTPSTSATGTSFNTSFEGPSERTLVGIFGNQVTVDGDVMVAGAGVVGLMVGAFSAAPVINGNMSISATSATVTELDTLDSPTATTTTYGDTAIMLGQFSSGSGSGAMIGPADVNGDLTMTAARDAHLLLNADIRDELTVKADRDIDTTLPAIFQDEEDPDALPEVTLDVTAGGLGLAAGGNIDFGSGMLDVNNTWGNSIAAGGDVILGTTNLAIGGLSINAGNNITVAGGNFTIGGLRLLAGGNIDFSNIILDVDYGGFMRLIAGNNLILGITTLTTQYLTIEVGNNFTVAGGNFTTGGLHLMTGGNIDFGSAMLDVDTDQSIWLFAGGDIILGTTNLTTTAAVGIEAGNNITVADGSFTTHWLSITAGNNIDFSNILLDADSDFDISLSAGNDAILGTTNLTTTEALTIDIGNNFAITGGSFTAGDLSLTAGGNIGFGSDTLDVNTTRDIAVVAGGTVDFGNATLETTQLLSVVAGGSITNGSGNFTADGLALISNASINMGSTIFTVGDSVFADIPGDDLLLLGLGVEQLAPPSSSPNATFVAGDSVNIGALSVAGGYAWFETHEVTFDGAITGPANLLVQFTPFAGTGNVTISGGISAGGAKPAIAGLILDEGDLIDIQDGATIVIGTSDYTGAITIGAINIDGRNFVAATDGTIDSLDNITSTGKVRSLSEMLATALFDQPTLDEINTDYYNSNPVGDDSETGEEEGEDTDGDGIADAEADNALIKHDSSGETKICAG